MYLPIKVLETKGEGVIESAIISVELRKGDQIRIHEQSAFGIVFMPFEIVGFEDGHSGRRVLLRSPAGDLTHMETGSTMEVWRSDREAGR